MEKEKLYRFFEGTASLDEEKQVRQWLENSPDNSRIMSEERKFFDMITIFPQMDSVIEEEKLPRKRRLFVMELLKAAAVALIVLAASYMYTHFIKDSGEVAMQTVTVPAGQRVNLLLPDGSKVWLNARTKLTYPVTFGRKNREMKLEGEGYFEVMADAKRPFIVHTDKGQITALGTKFNVEDYTGKDVFETTLMSGKVVVRYNQNPSEDITLIPDRKAVLLNNKLFVETVDDYTRYRWVDGLICFKDESFLAVMKEFEKYYGVTIRVKSSQMGKYVFTGKFRHTDGVDYALRVLQRDVKFKYSRDDEQQIIYIE